MDKGLLEAVGRKLGRQVTSCSSLSGGDINEAFRVELSDGQRIFVKSHPRAPSAMFSTEARGLGWLREAGALRIPEVLAVSETGEEGPRFLALEYIESRPPGRGFDEVLGRGLAALHRSGAPSFGLDHDNFIGSLEQSNEPRPSWPTFYRTQRLEPQLRRATSRGLIDPRLLRDFDVLFDRLESLVGLAEKPSRLHGDLWGGNLHIDDHGAPCLIDPAVYGGHREIDLAMMRLFGGFGAGVFDAYGEAWPLAPGANERVPLYQLYPLFVHVNLFGGGYVGQLTRALHQALGAT
jgi:fructosamine-3-kinase